MEPKTKEVIKRLTIPGYGWSKSHKARKARKGAADAAHSGVAFKLSFPAPPITVYNDGTITSKFGSGSIRGATATVDQSGTDGFAKQQQVYLTIVGPEINIVASVTPGAAIITEARKFAAAINRGAMQLGANWVSLPAGAKLDAHGV